MPAFMTEESDWKIKFETRKPEGVRSCLQVILGRQLVELDQGHEILYVDRSHRRSAGDFDWRKSATCKEVSVHCRKSLSLNLYCICCCNAYILPLFSQRSGHNVDISSKSNRSIISLKIQLRGVLFVSEFCRLDKLWSAANHSHML